MIVYPPIYLMIILMYYKYYYSFIIGQNLKKANFSEARMTSILKQGSIAYGYIYVVCICHPLPTPNPLVSPKS